MGGVIEPVVRCPGCWKLLSRLDRSVSIEHGDLCRPCQIRADYRKLEPFGEGLVPSLMRVNGLVRVVAFPRWSTSRWRERGRGK